MPDFQVQTQEKRGLPVDRAWKLEAEALGVVRRVVLAYWLGCQVARTDLAFLCYPLDTTKRMYFLGNSWNSK